MTWVKFVGDFDFSPDAMRGRVTLAYKKGAVLNVTRECATKAIAAAKAIRAAPEKRREDQQH